MKPTDVPAGDRRTVLVTGISTPYPVGMVLVDRDGEEWTVTGRTAGGDVRVFCAEPSDPDDRGDGPSFPWTLPVVEQWFGPLVPKAMVREEELEERDLVLVDCEFTRDFGPDMWRWQPWQIEQYLDALAKVHAQFSPRGVAS